MRIDVRALQDERQRLHGANQPRQTLRAATAGQQPDLRFRQSQLNLRIVRDDPIMARERHFETAAQRETIDRGRNRLAAGFEFAQGVVKLHDAIVARRNRILRRRARAARIAFHLVKRRAGAEAVRLAAGDDETLDGRIVRNLLRNRREFGDCRARQHIHAAAGNIPDQGDNAVGILVPFEIGEVHVRDPL